MEERRRPRTENHEAFPGGPPGGLSDVVPLAGGVEVAHGTYRESLPVAGRTVAFVRHRFADRLDVHPQAVALVDGDRVDDATVLRAGQRLTFVRLSGEKGRA